MKVQAPRAFTHGASTGRRDQRIAIGLIMPCTAPRYLEGPSLNRNS
jgi:hypothetical protein